MHQRTNDNAFISENAAQKSNSTNNRACIHVDISHLGEFDTSLLDLLMRQPAVAIPIFENAAADALKSLLIELKSQNNFDDDNLNFNNNDEDMNVINQNLGNENSNNLDDFEGTAIQILLRGNLTPTPLRSIQSHHLNTLVRCTGIVISASRVRSRATKIHLRCSRCQHATTVYANNGPFGSIVLPQLCGSTAEGAGNVCGPTPYAVVPDDCSFVDQQSLKLQEAPEVVPTGEMPRSVVLAVERGLVDKAPPGTRVSIMAVVSLFNSGRGKSGNTVKTVYLRVLGMQKDMGNGEHASFTQREEEAFRLLARRPDIYDILSRSIAPSISGSYTHDIKKAITCMLFSGSRKRLPDGMRLRGDINVLLLGDPSMAKSQFLKYATRVAPVGVYTSGKGSSAAGLTASVVKDQRGEFYLEGGAMVLADGGIVAIDEFDKMRPADRVAIHEAMEQQTISIAKAGITTVLNSRSSVLAAANPVYGRYDELKSASENIDLMTTILSRFDLIFLVRDFRDEELDKMICHHVMGVHINNSRGGPDTITGSSFGMGLDSGAEDGGLFQEQAREAISNANASPEAIADNAMRIATTGVGDLDVPTMKKYIQYCKTKCTPRLDEESGDILVSSYVKIRDDVRRRSMESVQGKEDEGSSDQATIPITVRQLEALIRISESLAKMRLEDDVQGQDIQEALRLFKVSTMAANTVDQTAKTVSSGENNTYSLQGMLPSRAEMQRSEAFLRSRLAIGAFVNKSRIIDEAVSQGYDATVISRAIAIMSMKGEIVEKNSGRLFKRVK